MRAATHARPRQRTMADVGRIAFAGLFLGGSLVHLVLGLFAADSYEPFADGALVAIARDTWTDVFLAHPTAWALALAALELAIGSMLLRRRGLFRTAGYGLAIAFHLALMAFGWGYWLWTLPALLVLVLVVRADPER